MITNSQVYEELHRVANDWYADLAPVRRSPDPSEVYRHYERLRRRIDPLRQALLHHPMYDKVDSVERLRDFMQIHVFAVWDFMSLVKRLQREVTIQRLPWMPPPSAKIARFANEVVLGEESDLGPDNEPASHFELYLRAMDEIGADTAVVRGLVEKLRRGKDWQMAFKELGVPSAITEFVEGTLECAMQGSVVEVASYFFFGREDVIPDMFLRLLKLWNNGAVEVPYFAYYLKRHIELDGDSHGPWAREMLMRLAGDDENSWKLATAAAERAITSRIRLWDNVLIQLGNR